MMDEQDKTERDRSARIEAEIADSFDEELEMELDDGRLARLLDGEDRDEDAGLLDRQFYFKELFRLQHELIKLQDWVVNTKAKVVVMFEGRDAAGKGGVIKRITQRLNPRVVRVVALPAPTERERSQWYFQRYVPHLPAGGEVVLFDRSWYNRAGVERVMGFCTDTDVEEFFRTVPEFEKMLGGPGSRSSSTGSRFPMMSSICDFRCASTIPSSSGSSRRWTWSPDAGGKTTRRPRKRCSNARTFPKRPGGSCTPTTRSAPGSTAFITS